MSLVACQRDATLRLLRTEALECRPSGDGWIAILADTILYPEGGGQPADHGRIDEAHVVDVQKRQGRVEHRLTQPIAPGPVTVQVDWTRRFDHMQQHTAQHLLTAIAQARFGLSTTSFHLHPIAPGHPVPRCDIELDGTPTVEQLNELEAAANAAIREHRAVRPAVHDRAKAAELDVRSRGLPEDVQDVRIVSIEGIDANTCGGTHVSHLGELQVICLLGTERIRGGTRLFYAAGGRVLAMLEDSRQRTDALNRLLSEGPEGHASAVQRLLDRAKSAEKDAKAQQLELAELLGEELGRRDQPFIAFHRDRADIPFLNAVAGRALGPDDPRILLLTAGAGDEGSFLLAGPPERVAALKADVLELLGARGGGRPGRLQGRASRLSARDEVAELIP